MSRPKSETIALEFPVQLADRLLTEVTMRRPTVRDLRQHLRQGRSDAENEIDMFCALSGLREEEMEMLDVADYSQLQHLYQRFCAPVERRTDTRSGVASVQADKVGAE